MSKKTKVQAKSKRRSNVAFKFKVGLPTESEWHKKWKASEQRKAKKLLDKAIALIEQTPSEAFADIKKTLPPKTSIEDFVGKTSLMKVISDARQHLYAILSLTDKQIAQYVWRVAHVMLGAKNKTKNTKQTARTGSVVNRRAR